LIHAPVPPRRWRLDADGLIAAARYVPSPNQDDRPPGARVRLLVVHGISLPPGKFGGDAVERLFTNRLDPGEHPCFAEVAGLRVSAHFLVRRAGELVQFVPAGRRAWHAGASCWRGAERCNDFSIGVELEGCDWKRYTAKQYRALNRLTASLRESFPLEAVAGHADIAPGRKTDPGPAFDWSRFTAAATLSRRA
jgi:AmpD protein